jgi:hypothetical protein
MAANNNVGISLMKSEETRAILEYLDETAPGVRVSDRDCFYKIERDGKLDFNMETISEFLGRDIDTETFLVNMSTYYGRITVSEGLLEISSEIEPDRFKE